MSVERAAATFRARFGSEPMVVASAPGRINLIGEHTDYNEGFVLPMAIPMRAWVAMSTRDDRRRIVQSADLGETELSDLDCEPEPRGAWHDLARGLLCRLDAPVNVTIASDVPRGAGLSSSAAVAMAIARGWCEMRGAAWDPVSMARAGQYAENVFVGVASGVMDQLVAAVARESALLIDCRDLSIRDVTLPADAAIVVMDTGVRRTLSGSEYNARRATCESVVAKLRQLHSSVRALRDVTPGMLATHADVLSGIELRRARHVVTENARVVAFVDALNRGDVSDAGAAMDASHLSLCNDYEVSGLQLDIACKLAREHPACFGARLTGAGFGGCAIALVRSSAADDFIAHVQPRYEAATYTRSRFFIARPARGAAIDARTGTPVRPAGG